MANIVGKRETMRNKLSEEEIDKIIVKQADDNLAWEEAIYVCKTEPTSLSIPANLAARATFLAKLHRQTSITRRSSFMLMR